MAIPPPEEGSGVPDPTPGGLGFPVCGPFSTLGSWAQKDVVSRGYFVSCSPLGRAVGVSAAARGDKTGGTVERGEHH